MESGEGESLYETTIAGRGKCETMERMGERLKTEEEHSSQSAKIFQK